MTLTQHIEREQAEFEKYYFNEANEDWSVGEYNAFLSASLANCYKIAYNNGYESNKDRG